MRKLKSALPVIGCIFLFLLTLVNFTIKNEVVTGIVGIVLFFVVLVIFVITRKVKD
ncbi:hypothetical protein [Massilibacterium senegalense]|uniref:hypothetical protein n=1 Tax=Massilibacterium senegalense TaxID=1632858 RepID=UPI00164D0606|nr:hypothetical protein [Massilibacterium senegalense]